jgi:hypothetical protein
VLRKLLVLIAILTSTLSACGDAAAASLSDAATRTLDAATARFELTISFDDLGELSPLAPDGPAVLHATGAYDVPAARSSMQLDVGDLLAGTGLSSSGEPLELVVDGDDTYMRFAPLEQLLGAAGWVRTDGEQIAGLLGGDAGGATSGASPTALLRTLVDAADVETVGADEVRGVATTHHRGTLDEQAIAELADGLAEGEQLDLDAWVDDSGLVRRLELARDGVTFRVELFDFGEAVDIAVPSRDEVTELPGGGR